MKLRKSQLKNVVHEDHIYLDRHFFSKEGKDVHQKQLSKVVPKDMKTNFGITVTHNYLFLLLHLRCSLNTKNILGINIPDICIFHNHLPYDILYNEQGQIKGTRDFQKVHMHKVYYLFLGKSKAKGIPKNEQCVACFQNDEFLLLSDTDLFISCRKLKNDPFFNKIVYIRNRLDVVQSGISVDFDGYKDCQFAGKVVQSFLGFNTDQQMLQKYGRDLYLRYLTQKIALFINIEQNIRIKTARFLFSKTTKGIFYLMDVQNLIFENLTLALEKLELRLKNQEEKLADKIIIKEEEYKKVKHRQNEPQVKELEKEMDNFFYQTARKFHIRTNNSSLKEYQKNQEAFNKLFPNFKERMKSTLISMNIRQIRQKILRTEVDYSSLYFKKSTSKNRFLKTEPSKFRRTSLGDVGSRRFFSLKASQTSEIKYHKY